MLQAKESTRGAVKARESGYLKAAISNIMEKATQVQDTSPLQEPMLTMLT